MAALPLVRSARALGSSSVYGVYARMVSRSVLSESE
jgi:hypothetical protein